MKTLKKTICVVLTFVMILGTMMAPVHTVNAAVDYPSELYLTQSGSGKCTLCSATMMLRARTYLSNNSNWSSITESAIRSTAWLEGAGLRWSWTYKFDGCSITVGHKSLSGISVSSLKAVLDDHPEGIVLYVKSLPHAVFLTDYEGDTFYCADTVSGYSGKRIPLTSSWTGKKIGSQSSILSSVSAYWYVSSYSIPSNVEIPKETYAVEYDANGGSGAPASQTKTQGTAITLSSTVPTREGYEFLGWATSSTATSAQYQPGANYSTDSSVVFYAVWEEIPDPMPFDDVEEGAYYYDSVLWAYLNGIASGVSETEFLPEEACTRGQVVTFLWKAAGSPASSIESPFVDVWSGAYYNDAILWAYENGIASGVTQAEFQPDAVCTRGQVVSFLYRMAGSPGASITNPFYDIGEYDYYYNAVLWAYENGITTGMSEHFFAPGDVCTRGQVVTFLYRQYN